jgi:hypothetical protein
LSKTRVLTGILPSPFSLLLPPSPFSPKIKGVPVIPPSWPAWDKRWLKVDDHQSTPGRGAATSPLKSSASLNLIPAHTFTKDGATGGAMGSGADGGRHGDAANHGDYEGLASAVSVESPDWFRVTNVKHQKKYTGPEYNPIWSSRYCKHADAYDAETYTKVADEDKDSAVSRDAPAYFHNNAVYGVPIQ